MGVLADTRGRRRPGVHDHGHRARIKPLKSGGSREKVSYADRDQSNTFLDERIDAARSVNELVGLLSETVLCALLADDNAVPQSKRITNAVGAAT